MQSYSPQPTRNRIQNNQNPYLPVPNYYHSTPQKRFAPASYGTSINSFSSPYKSQKNAERQQILKQNSNIKQNVSFARNYKARLYGADPQQEHLKQQIQQQYRIELRQQIEEDRKRRQVRIAKEKAEDEKLERKFYQNIQIEAQTKAAKKEEPSYFVVRSSKGKRAKANNKASENQQQSLLINNFLENSRVQNKNKEVQEHQKKMVATAQKIIKRGGYHNKSSLDNSAQNSQLGQQQQLSANQRAMRSLPDEYVNEIAYEQQRINRLMLSQQNMLRKLDSFKKQILETSKTMQLDQELQKVRLKLRAKPLNMQKLYSLNPRDGMEDVVLNNSEFYRLPLITKNHKIYEGDRETNKIREKQQKQLKLAEERSQSLENQRTIQEPKQLVQLHDKSSLNDKNVANPQEIQAGQ